MSMSPLRSSLVWLGRRAGLVIAIGVFAGLLIPPLATLLRPLLLVGIVLPFLVALIRIDWHCLSAHLRAPGLVLLALAWLLIAQPLLAFLVIRPLGLPGALETGVVLSATAPPLMASAALALILGLDAALAVLLTVAATALMPLTLPPLALLLPGIEMEIGTGVLMRRLATVVTVAFVAACLLRRLLPRSFATRHAEALDGLAVIGLLLFALAIMDGATAMLLRDPVFGLGCLAAVYAANIGFQILGAATFSWRGASVALTLGLCSGNVNLGLLVAALADHASDALAVYVAMALFPIYTLPALLRPLYTRCCGRSGRSQPPHERDRTLEPSA